MSKRIEILKHVSVYSFASQVVQVITLISGILIRNFLGPFQMGIWATLKLILDYSKYTTLGTTNATAREIPYCIGKKDGGTADEIKNLVVSFGVVVSVICAIGVFVFALLYRSAVPEVLFWGLIACSFLIILQRFNNLLIVLLRAYKEFHLASSQMMLSAVVNLALIVLLAYRFKIYGFLWATALSFIFNIVFILWKSNFQFRFILNHKLKGLISFGAPLMLLGVLAAVLRSVDKILIINMLGFEEMGFYSVAIMATAFLGQVPNSMDVVMLPHLQEKYGVRDKSEDVKGYIEKATYAYSMIMPVLIGLCWIAAPFFVKILMPKYVIGITALQFLILGTYFMALSFPYGNFIITLKKHLLMFPITGAVILLAIMLDIFAIKSGYGINGVALATTVSLFFYFLLLYWVVSKRLYPSRERLLIFIKVLLNFVLLIAVLMLLKHAVVLSSYETTVFVQFIIFMFLCVPFVLLLNKKFRLFGFIKENLIRRK